MKIDIKNLSGLPFESNEEAYQRCCDRAVAEAKKNESVVALYLLGGKWCPGVSDMDILVVYKDENAVPLISPWELSPEAAKIFTHRYVTFNEKNFKNLYYLYPQTTTNIRCLYGKNILIEDPSDYLHKDTISVLLAFNMVDVLVNKILLFPSYKIAFQKKSLINMRKIIGEIYSLTYTFQLLKEITGKSIGEEFVRNMRNLRDIWFDDDLENNVEKLYSLLNEGIMLSLDVVHIFDEFLKGKNISKNHSFVFKNQKYLINFVSDWSRDRYLELFYKNYINITLPYRNIESFYITLPKSFGYFFASYASGDGQFSAGMLKSLIGHKNRSFVSDQGAVKHIQVMNDVFKSAVRNNDLYKMSFSYGVTVNAKRTLSNIVARIILFFCKNFKTVCLKKNN